MFASVRGKKKSFISLCTFPKLSEVENRFILIFISLSGEGKNDLRINNFIGVMNIFFFMGKCKLNK